MTDKSVSIIIPCFNNARYIGKAIESALAQTHDDIQTVVVDDGSTDGSDEVIESFGDKILHLTQENAGACVARNNGISHATGNYIKFLDADDILIPDCIKTQLDQVGGRNVVVFGDHINLSESNIEYADHSHSVANNMKESGLANLETFMLKPVLISSTLYKRAKLASIGGFDPSRHRGQEFDLHLRLYANGVDFEYHPMICFKYRQHDSLSRISKKNFGNPIYSVDALQRVAELMRDGPRNSEWSTNRILLAKMSWVVGRNLLRQGDNLKAESFFALSQSLAGRKGIKGSFLYRFASNLFGPQTSEWLSSAGKKILLR